MSFKIHIVYEFHEGPWGGGNQFLKALKAMLSEMGAYADDPFSADALLFNSHHFGAEQKDLDTLLHLRREKPHIPFIHRIDGPIKLVRGGSAAADNLLFLANRIFSDGTVFQTKWSWEKSENLGYSAAQPVTQILNAADAGIFNTSGKKDPGQKFRLIAVSWAANSRKGFDVYSYLDHNLDFNRYEMTFVGNSPAVFKNIKVSPPVASRELSNILRGHDIFITGSINDPCSNALIEAMSCGLPAVARNSGGHPEIVGGGGIVFNDCSDVLHSIDTITQSYKKYQNSINLPSIREIATHYIDFARLCSARRTGHDSYDLPLQVKRLRRALKNQKMRDRFEGAIRRHIAKRG